MIEHDANGFDALFRKAEQRESFWVETAKLDYCEGLRNLMKRRGWSKTELAKRLGVSKAYITKVFQGDANFTLETMVKLAHALGGRVHVHVGEQAARLRVTEIISGGRPARLPARDEFHLIGTQKGRTYEPGDHGQSTVAA